MNSSISRRQLLQTGGVAAAAALGGVALGRTSAGDAPAAARSSGGEAGAPIRIGSAYPLSGPLANDGAQMRNGAALAIDEVNARGGVAGRSLEHVVIDANVTTPEGIESAFRNLIGQEVDAITVGFLTVYAGIDFDLASQYGAPYLNASTSTINEQKVASDPEKYGSIFQTDPSERFYASSFVPFLDDLSGRGLWKPSSNRLFVVYGDGPGPTAVHDAVKSTIDASPNWEFAGSSRVVPPVTDWSATLAELRKAGPAAVMHAHPVPGEQAAFMNQFAADPTPSLMYLIYGPSVPEFAEIAGQNGDGVVWSTVTGTYRDRLGQAFLAAYQDKFSAEPGFSNAGTAYDQVQMLARAWGSVSDVRDFAAVSGVLRTQIHRGVNGSYYLNNPGQASLCYTSQPPEVWEGPDEMATFTDDPSIGQAHLFYQLNGGEQQIIAPSPFDAASFEPPAYLA